MAAPEAQQSRLLALPRELRDEIYTLAFESTEVDLAWNGDKHRNNGIVSLRAVSCSDSLNSFAFADPRFQTHLRGDHRPLLQAHALSCLLRQDARSLAHQSADQLS